MPPILYDSQYTINIPSNQMKSISNNLGNIILKSNEYLDRIEKQKKIIKKPLKKKKET